MTTLKEAPPKKYSFSYVIEDLERRSSDQFSELRQLEEKLKEASLLFQERLKSLEQLSSQLLSKYLEIARMNTDPNISLKIQLMNFQAELESISAQLKKATLKIFGEFTK